MTMTKAHTEILNDRLLEIREGSSEATDFAIEHTCERLRLLARTMLRKFPNVGRWSQTDDVLQNALIRLHKSLSDVKPETPKQFYGLAATQIRRELLDLARKFQGAMGVGANHQTDHEELHVTNQATESARPESLESWTAFHESIESLPDDLQDVVNLLWYEGMAQPAAAEVLGVSLATLKRRWRLARLRLFERLKDVEFT